MTADEIEEYVKLANENLDELEKLSRAMRQRAIEDKLMIYKSITYHIEHLTDEVKKLLNAMLEEANEQEDSDQAEE